LSRRIEQRSWTVELDTEPDGGKFLRLVEERASGSESQPPGRGVRIDATANQVRLLDNSHGFRSVTCTVREIGDAAVRPLLGGG
jgi:hypothetical protein